MKAVVFHGIGDIRIDDVPEPRIRDPRDAVVRITAGAICSTDFHLVRGTMGDLKPGTILGHEGVGIIEEVGRDVRNLRPGDRVVIASSVDGGSFFGGPAFDGLQAEKARVPLANVGCVRIPDEIPDDQALLCSHIFPTAWSGAAMADIKEGDAVAVFGCGPVGLLAIASANLLGAGRVFAVDAGRDRLDAARGLGAEAIDFNDDDPVEALRSLTDGAGVDRAIDAAGDAPSQALLWSVSALARAGTLSIVGVYPETAAWFPIGEAMGKNLAVHLGTCPHRRLIPKLLRLIRTGSVDPTAILPPHDHLTGALEAYKAFDRRQPGWTRVELEPALAPRP